MILTSPSILFDSKWIFSFLDALLADLQFTAGIGSSGDAAPAPTVNGINGTHSDSSPQAGQPKPFTYSPIPIRGKSSQSSHGENSDISELDSLLDDLGDRSMYI